MYHSVRDSIVANIGTYELSDALEFAANHENRELFEDILDSARRNGHINDGRIDTFFRGACFFGRIDLIYLFSTHVSSCSISSCLASSHCLGSFFVRIPPIV